MVMIPPSPLAEGYREKLDALLERHPPASSSVSLEPAELEALLELVAMSSALDVTQELCLIPRPQRERLRRLGARALLQLAPPSAEAGELSEEEQELREGMVFLEWYAREGLRALASAEGAAPAGQRGGEREGEGDREGRAVRVLDAEIVGLYRGSFDGLRLAEIAHRVARSPSAQQALALLRRTSIARVGAERSEAPVEGLRLAADGGSPIRDPDAGHLVRAVTVGEHEIELFRFADGVLVAYAGANVPLRLEGEGVVLRTARYGYVEALLEGDVQTVELGVGEASVTLALGRPEREGD